MRDGIPQEPPSKPEKVSYRVEAGSKGGMRGGLARANALSPKKRKKIAFLAEKARWSK
jgi:hypothetical protein